jgi:Mg2+/Co2+ transporter CorB
MPIAVLTSILLFSILTCAFFSAAETAVISLNRQRLKRLQTAGNRNARRVNRLLKRPARLRSTLFFCNTAFTILAAASAALIGQQLAGASGAVAALLLLTPLLLIAAAILPRNIAAHLPERIAFPASHVLMPLTRLLTPLVILFDHITSWLLARCGAGTRREERPRGDELRNIVGDSGQLIPRRHMETMLRILELERMTVADVLVPRAEMVGLDLDASDEALIAQLRACEFSRVPVWRDSRDNIVGILHVRAVARCLDGPDHIDRGALMAEIYEPYFAPVSTHLQAQLANFSREKRRLAIVVDEYGSVQGLVTREDIIERIVGEFVVQQGTEPNGIEPEGDGSYRIQGTVSLHEINRHLNWGLPTEGPRTLSGLLLEHLEHFPEAAVGVCLGEYCFDDLELEGKVVRRARAFRRLAH